MPRKQRHSGYLSRLKDDGLASQAQQVFTKVHGESTYDDPRFGDVESRFKAQQVEITRALTGFHQQFFAAHLLDGQKIRTGGVRA